MSANADKFIAGALSRKRDFGMKLNRRVGIGHSFIKLEVDSSRNAHNEQKPLLHQLN